MARYTFFTNPMSRGQIARWALHEAGANYHQVLVPWTNKPAELLAANPMGKLPTIIDHAPEGDRVVSEAAAICAYLADEHPEAGLAPREAERADYYRWLFFTAGPLEQATAARAQGWAPKDARAEISLGFGTYRKTVDTLEDHFSRNAFVCGDRFTMADVYVGVAVDWGLTFGSLPPEPGFAAYAERIQRREAYKAAKAIDNALIQESRK